MNKITSAAATVTVEDLIRNFPFLTLRDKQSCVLKEIESALASGYKYIILEAPTGFGKSPVAIAAALTLGSSYICTSTKNLQTQYTKDFIFVKSAKGKSFVCEVKVEDEGKGKNDSLNNNTRTSTPSPSRIYTTAKYGPCMHDKNFICEYKPRLKDYTVVNQGTKKEMVLLSS